MRGDSSLWIEMRLWPFFFRLRQRRSCARGTPLAATETSLPACLTSSPNGGSGYSLWSPVSTLPYSAGMRRFMAVVAVFCVAAASPVSAGIHGSVKDPSGGAVAAAEVVLTPARAVVATVRTDASGRFGKGPHTWRLSLLLARSPSFEERSAAVDAADAVVTVDLTLTVAALEEEVTVTAAPGEVIETRHAAQAVNLVSVDEIAQRANTALAQAVNEEVGVNLQRKSDDGGRVRARADWQQGQRLRRRRALLEQRAARRRQHVLRPGRAEQSRRDRDSARTQQRGVRQ